MLHTPGRSTAEAAAAVPAGAGIPVSGSPAGGGCARGAVLLSDSAARCRFSRSFSGPLPELWEFPPAPEETLPLLSLGGDGPESGTAAGPIRRVSGAALSREPRGLPHAGAKAHRSRGAVRFAFRCAHQS